MNKFWIGMACGIILCFATAAVASKAVQGTLFPSKITIYNGAQMKELSTTKGTVVINYKNQTYIPLRLFSESLGATVSFQSASSANGNLNQIQVFSPSTLSGLNMVSNEGYASAGHLLTNKNVDGYIEGGIIKINKEMKGKQIVLEAIKDNQVVGESDYFYIDNENINPPKPGDIRAFKTSLAFAYHHKDVTYRLKVLNFVHVKSNPIGELNEREQEYFTHPLYGVLTPPFGSGDGYPIADRAVMPFSFNLTNVSDDPLVLDEAPLSFIVYKSNPDGSNPKKVTEYKLPPLKGKLEPDEAFQLTIPWYMKDTTGTVKPGDYLVSLVIPEKIHLLNKTTGEKREWNVSLRYGTLFGIKMI
ncbi:hypothetical protein D3P07_09105 [Paenibacillus sp. 1011MAR3C5]|uniref:hypothetical protein n=1 Tax=Paenibacillus sp. 1011MAR3C5 TaxID=1675787 RepID=UPI000E6C40AB|nr:hypothetical protein [Paenibacillus sp. 1011MAR3C5]RJE90348.1 hypothetical protein D3P07_09105 [Paenibacillus sp. 1011MAR3C5]